MKLEKIRDSYYQYSASASAISRQAAFAGIAIVWVFKHQDGSSFAIPADLVFPLLMFMSSLASDLLHYISGAIIWGTLNRVKEKELGHDFKGDILVTSKVNWVTTVFFATKLFLVVLGYLSLVIFGIGELGIKN